MAKYSRYSRRHANRHHRHSDGGAMPTDAKLGLFVGVVLVITIGIVFFRRDLTVTQSAAIPNQRSATVAGAVALPRPGMGEERALQGKLMSNPTHSEPEME